MTRKEHLDWTRERAEAYLKGGDLAGALASFVSDIPKHYDTAKIAASPVFFTMMALAQSQVIAGDTQGLRSTLMGFN